MFCKKDVLRKFAKFTGKCLCQDLFFCNFIKKEALAQVFPCGFCKISKNTFSHRTSAVAVSFNYVSGWLQQKPWNFFIRKIFLLIVKILFVRNINRKSLNDNNETKITQQHIKSWLFHPIHPFNLNFYTARFLKYVWSFFNIMHEREKWLWLKLQMVFAKHQKTFYVIARYRFSSYKHRNIIRYICYNL